MPADALLYLGPSHLAFAFFLGLSLLFSGVSRVRDALFLGGVVTGLLLLAGLYQYVLERWVLSVLDVRAFRFMGFLLGFGGVLVLLFLLLRRVAPGEDGRWLELVRRGDLVALVLGGVLVVLEGEGSLGWSLWGLLWAGVGFTAGLLFFVGILHRVEGPEVPGPLRGLPVRTVCAGLVALVVEVTGYALYPLFV
ncbi:Rnf-Nqr domain containing protein [Spirochaeta thermophila]|uniref:Uncharacterized protein n=1 Tax=Winmispira thermophila (strain ATCC 49972 / DSM 6192 / RI 19.B1) TaxID=665571 RepID=E0RQ33_WINT6|nr:Rnf-Nqr domain containing protein [Spirochaeta thermophila]ADN01417.1 hypothetical protein STHERM_c04450 [Spirochaeta thermophila DSM 6192]